MRRRRAAWLAAVSLVAGLACPAGAEVDEVKLSLQFGIGYLPLTIAKHDQLVEKQLARGGLGATRVAWTRFATGSAANDALISGTLHFAAGGTGPAFILWDKTRNSVDVRGVGALTSMPNLLVTRNAGVRSIRDFTERDRIAMAGAGSSVQTMYLQMAVAGEYGMENHKRLNALMVNLPHPEGLRALLSGTGEITAQFTSPPYQYYALETAGVHSVLNSYDVMGGPNTFLMVWSTGKFRSANPRTYQAVVAALTEATAAINADKRRAAEVYVKEGGGKESVGRILKMLSDPQVKYTLAPERTLRFAEFMHRVGTIKNKPASWKDLFFPEVHELPGS